MNKINTREELTTLLDKHETVLSQRALYYFKSLIDLEFSIVRNYYITDNDRKILSNLEIYKKIAIYNIYNRALNLFYRQNKPFDIRDEEMYQVLSVYLDDKKLFEFDYNDIRNDYVPNGLISNNIGKISFYETINDIDENKQLANELIKKIEDKYLEENPYKHAPSLFSGHASYWDYEHKKEISELEEKYTKLSEKINLTEQEKSEIEVTKNIHDAFFEDYGLSNEEFKFESVNDDGKVMTLRRPNLLIKNNIRNI